MPKTPKTPQEKKRLSLLKDRRNSYGENAKSSRKNIPRSKALSHRKVRHASKQALEHLDDLAEHRADAAESTIATPRLQKGKWKKSPDMPLAKVIKSKLARRKRDIGAKQKRRAVRLARAK